MSFIVELFPKSKKSTEFPEFLVIPNKYFKI